MQSPESERLECIASDSLYTQGVMPRATRYCFKIFERHLVGESIIELGPAEGLMTKNLISTGKCVTAVEGSSLFCDDLRRKLPQTTVINSLFEDFDPTETWDNVILGHVLEHVADPVLILRKTSRWLTPTGRIFAAVPNARSLHRQAGVIMGLLPFESALNELDHHHGHRRVFSPETFRACFHEAGLKIEIFGGYFLKPVSNRQVDEHWSADLVDAYLILGERYPDIASEIYIIARH